MFVVTQLHRCGLSPAAQDGDSSLVNECPSPQPRCWRMKGCEDSGSGKLHRRYRYNRYETSSYSHSGRDSVNPGPGEGGRGGDSGRGSVTSDILTQCALCGQQYTEPRVGPAAAASAINHVSISLQLLPCLHTFCSSCLWNFTPR